ncbi:MAG: hypothetical protein H0W61_09960 [Bacteroidetes bacterium]|nr:hypothetical protein [Bacteroidota bacterium]
MIKNLLIAFGLITSFSVYSQCTTNSGAVSDVTLQCSGGTANRSAVAFFPTKNTYYSVNAGNGSYPIETFTVTGGTALSTTEQVLLGI